MLSQAVNMIGARAVKPGHVTTTGPALPATPPGTPPASPLKSPPSTPLATSSRSPIDTPLEISIRNFAEHTEAFNVLTAGLPALDEDATFWWETTGSYLATGMAQAGYAPHDQYDGLLFYHRFVLPYMGARPTSNGKPSQFSSFITDDLSPFELSWSWGKKKPTVRFLIEAVGAESGLPSDPFNQKRTLEFVENLRISKPDIDWSWFDHFFKTLLVTNTPEQPKNNKTWQRYNPFSKSFWDTGASHRPYETSLRSLGHRSSIFIAFDLQRGKLLVKPYFLPEIRAIQTGKTPLQVISEGLRSFEHSKMSIPALDVMEEFVRSDPEGSLLKFLAIAPDCIEPTQSRLKIYCRSAHTSFDSVCAIMTLGGQIRNPLWESSMKDLRKLWYLALGLDEDFPTSAELPINDHCTAGIMYNIDIKPGTAMPEPKVYIPLKHYSRNDLNAAQGLSRFLKDQGRSGYTEGYMNLLAAMSTHRPLDSGRDIQTYLGCAFKNGTVDTSNYLSPSIFHEKRWI